VGSSNLTRNRAVQRLVKEILTVRDEDKIVLVLMLDLQHSSVKPVVDRIGRTYYTENATVGLHALRGMTHVVQRITEGKHDDGRLKNWRAILAVVAMCLAHGLAKGSSVSKEALYRTVYV
jgi:hypothetical protein